MPHLLLITFGSSGDVHPLLWLGRLLKLRGHQVSMIANGEFETPIREAGLSFFEAGTREEYNNAIQDKRLWKAGKGSQLALEAAAWCTDPYVEAASEASRENGHPDMILAHPTAFGARLLREKLHVPLITVHHLTLFLPSAYDTPVVHPKLQFFSALPRWLKRAILSLPNPVDFVTLSMVRKSCLTHGVAPPRSVWREWWNSPDGVVSLFPAWFYAAQPDWPANTLQWHFPLEDLANEQPMPRDLLAFLAAGERPVVFTPGSFNVHAKQFFETAVEAVRQIGCRAVFVTRAPEQVPTGLSDDFITVTYASFSDLLKHAAVFVHHGGIGTLSQGFAAGIPQLVMPMMHDQHDNAQRLERLGAGLSLSVAAFTPDRVAASLRRLLDDDKFHQAAQNCAKLIHQRPNSDILMDWIESRLIKPLEVPR